MSNTPVDPTGSSAALPLPEDAELYLRPADETPLSESDLVPNTTGDMDVEPTRQVTRTPLHNGKDFVSIGNLQGQAFTTRAFLTDNNPKLQEIKDAWVNGDPMKGNVFFRDGSGASFYCYITRVKTIDDPQGNQFAKDITIEPFGITPLDAPAS